MRAAAAAVLNGRSLYGGGGFLKMLPRVDIESVPSYRSKV